MTRKSSTINSQMNSDDDSEDSEKSPNQSARGRSGKPSTSSLGKEDVEMQTEQEVDKQVSRELKENAKSGN